MSVKNTYLLHIETTTTVCSVAVSENERLLAIREINEANVHASVLTLFIEEVIADAGLTMADLAGIAVSKGPGSYTGLRIGVSVAKGLCYALDIPLIAVDTLRAMAMAFISADNASSKDTLYCPMIDARRMEVFTAFYDVGLEQISPTQALIVDADTFSGYSDRWKRIVLFGSGADKFALLFKNESDVSVCPGFENSASYLVADAYRKYSVGEFEDLVYFEPFYLKDFVATTPKKLF